MQTLSKTKWAVFAALALALPVSGVLSGCGGGSNGLAFNSGGGGGAQNAFANITGSGPLLRNGVNIGTLQFSVDANGTITGTLLGAGIVPRGTAAKKATRVPAVPVTATSSVSANGAFTLTFNVTLEGVDQTLTFSGTLSRNGSNAAISGVSISSSVPGNFDINFTVSVSGSGNPNNPGNGTFTVSGGNAIGGSIGGTLDTLTAVRSGNQIIGLIFTFSSAGLNGSQTVTLSVNDGTVVSAKSYSIANGDAGASYAETPIANPQGTKAWEATAGNVEITAVSGTQATVSINNLSLSPSTINGNTATGTVTVSGSGTLTIQ